jgi:hypothetical protein
MQNNHLFTSTTTTTTTTTTTNNNNNHKHLYFNNTTLLSDSHYLSAKKPQGASSFWFLVFACYSLLLFRWQLDLLFVWWLLWGRRMWVFECSCWLALNDDTSTALHKGDRNVALTVFTFNCCNNLDTTYTTVQPTALSFLSTTKCFISTVHTYK